jgi:hypothetical protein
MLLQHSFPEARFPDIQTALQQAFGTTIVTDINLLTGGLSGSSVYKIEVEEQTYVLKLDTPASPVSPALLPASLAGIAPTVYYQDVETGITISALIDAKPLRAVMPPEKLVPELARVIKIIHDIPYHAEGPALQDTVQGLVSNFRASKVLAGPVFDECYTYWEQIKTHYPWQETRKVLSHNDLNPSNILCDGEKIWVIDWDTAYLNDEFVDLAAAANFFVHTPEQETAFLNMYFDGAVTDQHKAQLFVMRQVSRIIYATLMLGLAGKARDTHDQSMEGFTLRDVGAQLGAGLLSLATYEGQLAYGKAMINDAVAQMRSPRFATSIQVISAGKQ